MSAADRELLELAAKAAGVEWIESAAADWGGLLLADYSVWNPLASDADALRLAVKLHITVSSDERQACAMFSLDDLFFENAGADLLAATRRAIVRAAAEIGRAA